jgi:hypothetical protein
MQALHAESLAKMQPAGSEGVQLLKIPFLQGATVLGEGESFGEPVARANE